MLIFAVGAFALLIILKWYPAEIPSTNLDFDWFYRIPGRALLGWVSAATQALWKGAMEIGLGRINNALGRIYAVHGPEGQMARSWPIGFMAMWTAVVLGLVLVLAFVS
ncbi:MAG: hypothetical protein AAF850_06890 [Pseudomonadota bacterium]